METLTEIPSLLSPQREQQETKENNHIISSSRIERCKVFLFSFFSFLISFLSFLIF